MPGIFLSLAKALHANDPRTGNGAGRGQLIAAPREFQLFATEFFGSIQARLMLGQVRSSSEFAKIDPDIGLQANVGPGQNRFLTLQLNQRTAARFWQVSWSEADARDRVDGSALLEAPRMIVDAVIASAGSPLVSPGRPSLSM